MQTSWSCKLRGTQLDKGLGQTFAWSCQRANLIANLDSECWKTALSKFLEQFGQPVAFDCIGLLRFSLMTHAGSFSTCWIQICDQICSRTTSGFKNIHCLLCGVDIIRSSQYYRLHERRFGVSHKYKHIRIHTEFINPRVQIRRDVNTRATNIKIYNSRILIVK